MQTLREPAASLQVTQDTEKGLVVALETTQVRRLF
jgi:hypothetical protein